MRNLLRRGLTLAAAALAMIAGAGTGAGQATAADTAYKVLVFSKTAAFRHDSIPAGIQAIRDLGASANFTVDATEDGNAFTTANLGQYAAVVFLSTTGDVLNAAQQTAFESYVASGKGFVGVHAAADTEYDWPFYGQLVGAWFSSHPAIQPATVKVEDRAHAGTAHLGQSLTRTDEWYNYRTNPRTTAHVLATLDESSYSGGTMSGDHPTTWCKAYGGGRSFYTGGGHTIESYAESGFRAQLLGGIRYAAGKTRADCRPETGYTNLYDGSTTGWSHAGPGGFASADATLTSSGGLGMLWYSAKEFRSYSLKLDWKLAGDDNSGVFIGFPASDDPWSAVDNGYEIQIDATDTPDHTTGSVYGFKSADLAARDAALNPPGEWNTYELLVEGERVQILLNGVKINDFTNTVPARSLQQGYIGIQNHGDGDDAAFRHIRIKELGATGDRTVEAESYTTASGASPFDKPGAHGGRTLGFIDPGDWSSYAGTDLTGVTALRARVVSGGAGGAIQVRTGSATGTVLGTVNVPNTGSWETYADVQGSLTGVPTGAQTLFLTYTGTGTGLFDLDDFTLVKGTPPASRTGPVKGLAGKCLDVAGAATTDGTQVQLYGCNGTGAQTWTVTGQVLKALGKCLDVAGGATANGTKVQIWTCNGSAAQNWAAQSDGTLRNPQSGRCLDVTGASTADATPVAIRDCGTGAGQKWTLP
ncbi:ThuA domain-containing protein [Sphaerisporangium corydalis]|uniref:ThuA domain-containing protein n=1 Tax=Sphaerisporangium corydalis TaxID=1441875 RepID=A0ABV9EMI6_9ACTN|nr:ThuA domain-containing protein [Sphaerisporangium corydalis]